MRHLEPPRRLDGRERALGRLAEWLVGLAYPPRCVVATCAARGHWLCPDCVAGVVGLPPGRCPCCAGRLQHGACPTCALGRPPYRRVVAAGPYSGVLRDAVRALKYRGVRGVAPPLGRLLAERVPRMAPDALVVPLPAHRRRQSTRWVDHASLLARAVGKELSLPMARGLLVRTRDTRPQVGLDPEERRANVSAAFAVVGDASGATVLLVDDVMTTGASATAATRALRDAGARSVWVAVVARADQGTNDR